MEWQFVIALVLMVPVILFPVAFVWYLNINGLVQAMKARKIRREVRARPSA